MDGTWETSAVETKLCVWGSMTASLSEESAALTHLQKKTTKHMHPHVTKKKTSKVNIFKSAASVAHTRTACSLSSAADYFFLRRITVESKNEREVMSGSTTHEKQLQSTTSSSPPATTADPRLPTTHGSAYKTLQRVSERRDRNQSRMAGSNLISRRPRRCLRSERTTLQTTVLVTENLTTCSITVTDLLL